VKLLIVLPNWFGEALFVTPMLRALHAAQPDASIAVLGVPRSHEVLRGNPHIAEFLVYDERGADRGLAAKRALVRRLRAARFDVALILRRSLSRTLLLVFAGIPRGIGFANWKSGWLLTDPVPEPVVGHKAEAYLRLLAPLGITPSPGPCEYWPLAEERAWAADWLARHRVADGRPLIVVHPGANWPHKRWPAERYAELINRLGADGSATILLTGGPDDGPLVLEIAKRLTVPTTTLVGEGTLRQLAACLERANLVVTNDTGPVHLAAALRRPTIALFGPTLPSYTGPLGDPRLTRVLHHPDCCPTIPCYQPTHPSHPGMAAISVDEALAACDSLLPQTAVRRKTE
jgi:lipopolysaccharide heptosyltransferase II